MTPGPTRGGMRRWGRLVACVLAAVVVVTLAAGVDPAAWAGHLLASSDPLVAALDPPPRRGRPVHLLVVVSDERSGVEALGDHFGSLDGARADSVVLARVGSDGTVIESLPRGLRVSSTRGDLMLAELLDVDGPAGLVRAARDQTGRPVHHYLELDLPGVAAAVDALGGLEVDLRHPVRDRVSGFVAEAGHPRLDGAEAVAWLRSRQPESRVDGSWVAQPAGDLGRITRTQAAVRKLLDAAAVADLGTRGRFVLALARHSRVDRTLVVGSGLALTRWGAAPHRICASVLPTRPERSVVARTSTLGPPHSGALARRIVVPGTSDCDG